MYGGISTLLLRGGGEMDINIYFDTPSFCRDYLKIAFCLLPFLLVLNIEINESNDSDKQD